MLLIKDLVVQYTSAPPIIKGLNLSLPPAQIHGLIGLNGAGKTTLLHAICGIIPYQSGTITYHDHALSKHQIGYLETENFFYYFITGNEYLSLFPNPSFDIQKWNEIFDLPLDTVIENYSTGMKKKLALLGILKLDRPIVILDEPFNGLDLETSKLLQIIIGKLKERNKTIIITSHILESLTSLCDAMHYLENGTIKFSRTKAHFDHIESEIFDHLNKVALLDKLM